MPKDTDNRKILGAVIQSGRIFKAGDEVAFAAAMKGRSVQHLIDNGTISGDWDGVNNKSAAKSDREDDGAFKTTATTATEKDAVDLQKEVDKQAAASTDAPTSTKKKSSKKKK